MKLKPYEAVIEAYTNAKGELTDPVKMFYYLRGVLACCALQTEEYGTLAELEDLFIPDIRYLANQVNQKLIAQVQTRKRSRKHDLPKTNQSRLHVI